MKVSLSLAGLFILGLIFACKPKTELAATPLSKAEQIVSATIEAHGGKKYESAHYQFQFRGKIYSFQNGTNSFRYTRTADVNGKKTVDVLDNSGLQRSIDENVVVLTEKEKNKYAESVNSVIYFATLPYKLQDAAVNKAYKGETSIKGKNYHVLEVTFEQEGGGKDFDDQFHYWINQTENTIDYLAYNYQVNGGGVRFREAYNRRDVEGIIFQDYVNYKAAIGTPLADLARLFEQGKLEKLSLIETEAVRKLK